MKRVVLAGTVAILMITCGIACSRKNDSPAGTTREGHESDNSLEHGAGIWSDGPMTPKASEAPGATDGGRAQPEGDAPTSSEFPSTRRWAILASDSLVESGFPALVTATLATSDAVELVDREHLDETQGELEFSRLMSPRGIGQQLRLGVMLGAHRLLLLDGGSIFGAAPVRVKVVDTYSGACLFRGRLLLKTDNADAAAERLGQLATDIEERYAAGIQGVVGIPYFVSKSLESHYDDLKVEFPTVLATTLSRIPGVAVMSIEETHLINREMAFAGHDLRRFVPVFVSGEYAMHLGQGEQTKRLRVSVTISGGDQTVETLQRDDVTVTESRDWLRGPVSDRIKDYLAQADQKPLGLAQQEKLLLRQAEEMQQSGDVPQAIRLREAALLIRPNNALNRIQIILAREAGGEEHRDVAADYLHFDYLLRNHLINVIQGWKLAAKIDQWLPTLTARKYEEEGDQEARQALPPELWSKHAFFRNVFPRLNALPAPQSMQEEGLVPSPDMPTDPLTLAAQQRAYCQSGDWASRLSSSERDRTTMQIVDDVYTIVSGMRPGTLPYCTWKWPQQYADVCTPNELLDVSRRLRETGMAKNVFFAGFWELATLVSSGDSSLLRQTDIDPAQFAHLLDNLRTRQTAPLPKAYAENFTREIDDMAGELEKLLAGNSAPYDKFVDPIPVDVEPLIEIDAAMTIEEIADWPVPFEAVVHEPHKFRVPHVVKVNGTEDLVWSMNAVHVMSKVGGAPPACRQIYEPLSGMHIIRVRSDGRHAWVATSSGGIHVLSTGGEQVAWFGSENGLPAYCTPEEEVLKRSPKTHPFGKNVQIRRGNEWSEMTRNLTYRNDQLAIIPVAVGKCVAIGRSGSTLQTWIALLTLDESESEGERIHVLHSTSAPFPRDKDPVRDVADDLSVCFSTPWACIWENPDDAGERVLILGRFHDTYIESNHLPNTALAVDLKTFAVTTLAKRLPELAELGGVLSAASVNGSLIALTRDGVEAWYRRPNGTFVKTPISGQPLQDYYLLTDGSHVYCPGDRWLHVNLGDPVTTKVLADEMFPHFVSMERFAVSACYGFWANSVDGGVCYRIAPDSPSKKSISPYARIVPTEMLDKHLEAVEAIQRLGGRVERAFRCQTDSRLVREALRKQPEGMVVCLTEQWQGGDEGLRHLEDLHNLKGLLLLGGNLSQEGAVTIAQLPALRGVALVDLEMAPQAFKTLVSGTELDALYLDPGYPDPAVHGDAYVGSIGGLPWPRRVGLYGPSFTARTLKVLDEDRLTHLYLYGTAISQNDCKMLPRVENERLRVYFESPQGE